MTGSRSPPPRWYLQAYSACWHTAPRSAGRVGVDGRCLDRSRWDSFWALFVGPTHDAESLFVEDMGGTRIRPRARGNYNRVPLLVAGLGTGISLLVLFFYSAHSWDQARGGEGGRGGVDAGRCSFEAEGGREDATAMTRFALWAYQEGMVEAAGNCSRRAAEASPPPDSDESSMAAQRARQVL